MAELLRALLAEHRGRSLDVVTAYVNVQGLRLLRHGLADEPAMTRAWACGPGPL